MEDAAKTTQDYIFYLQLEKELPMFFINLAEQLLIYGISLIPVQLKEFDKISTQGKREHVMTIIQDMQTFLEFRDVRNKFFDFGILQKKYCYYDITSFENASSKYQMTHGKSYFHFRLPLKVSDIARDISHMYLNEKRKAELWPGGNKVRLPFDLKRLG